MSSPSFKTAKELLDLIDGEEIAIDDNNIHLLDDLLSFHSEVKIDSRGFTLQVKKYTISVTGTDYLTVKKIVHDLVFLEIKRRLEYRDGNLEDEIKRMLAVLPDDPDNYSFHARQQARYYPSPETVNYLLPQLNVS